MTSDKQQKGMVLEIQRMSTEDGPGIRTTVFLKGCSLKCAWCHNPESISPQPQVHWIATRCIGCRICVETCSEKALSTDDQGAIVINRSVCTACGSCAEACPSTAMELLGSLWETAPLARELAKDRAYFDTSGGGITVSGGEPALQSAFAADLLQQLAQEGIHTALDTCGNCPRDALERLLPHTRLLLFDLKAMDPERHRQLTGSDNRRILENITTIAGAMDNSGTPEQLWIRTPIIPGATDDQDNIRSIGRFIGRHLGRRVHRWELCAFNNLCLSKYERLGLPWQYKGQPLMTEEQMERLTEMARSAASLSDRVHWSGMTRTSGAVEDEAAACRNTLEEIS